MLTHQEPVTEELFTVTMFVAADLRFFHAPDDDVRVRVQVRDERSYIDVRVGQALPLSHPVEYLTLRTAEDKDIGVVKDWSGLDADSRKVVEAAMLRSYLLPKVLEVIDVQDRFGIVTWDVVTDRGERRYVVRNMRDNSVTLAPNRVLMTGVDGDRFEFPDINVYGQAALDVLLKVL